MRYFHFQRTQADVNECLDAMRSNMTLSRSEAEAMCCMFEDVLEFCQEGGIIEDYDCKELRDMFGLVTERGEGAEDE